jgi:curved DNA-binding protein CbpA
MDYYQILGVPRGCDLASLRRAFRKLSKEQHPDRFPESQRENAEKRYQKIVIAFNTLKDEKQRKRYDKRFRSGLGYRSKASEEEVREDPATMVRKYYQSGMTRLKQGQYEAAVESFKRAIHYQEDAEFYFQKAQAESQVPRLHKEAVNSLQRAIAIKPAERKYHENLVEQLITYGLNTRAKVYLDKALARFPDDEKLLELGRELDPKKYKKNLFGNLFGK